MNYLAHLLLSDDDPDVLVGNFIADGLKGGRPDDYPDGVRRGIRMHRLIDAYTDAHPVVERSRVRLRDSVRKFAGVVADVFYDHFLARSWDRYHPLPLQEFADDVYALLGRRRDELPERSRRFLGYMSRENILPRYGTVAGIDQVLKGLAHRTRFESGMDRAVGALVDDYEAYERDFDEFFPELRRHVAAHAASEP